MEPMPAWKPRAVLTASMRSLKSPSGLRRRWPLAGMAVVELDDPPSPLHDAIRAFLDKAER